MPPPKNVSRRAPSAPRVPLQEPSVVVRVRPLAESGGHSGDGPPVYKRLASWADGVVVLEDAHTRQQYSFARSILAPEATQGEVYDAAAAELIQAFVENEGYNVLLFAYGQTGTGKTHTIFGPEQSWQDIRHPDCGIFPRAVAAVFDSLQARRATTSFVLTASAMEFYMCQCTDLLDDNKPCLIGEDHAPVGLCSVPLEQPFDALGFMERVRAARTTRSTLMNKASGGHEGSSRSHCALILTLRQLDLESRLCTKTTLNVMDMAGAERPSSTAEDHTSAISAIMDYWRGKTPTTGGQGTVVNYELSALRTAVVQATEQHRMGRPLRVTKQLGTAFVEYASGCFSGSALLGMIVTLSPAPSCGWETWFSCTYGEDLRRLRAPVVPQKGKPFDQLLGACRDAAARSAEALSKTPASGPAAKYLPRRTVQARHDERESDLFSRIG
mmetsp:Transcript_43080/g.119146  ORF Transcript_43080/g.119146 Transcript_43080/m.119146 type:complete len:442 (+) Transcript_43080:109-1434(+)